MEYEDRKKLSWVMLDKKEEDLTPEEKILVKQYHEMLEERNTQLEKANEQLREDCKIVTSGPEKNLIPAYGWIYPIKEMAYAIEALNILYKKYRVRAVFDQVKEKYADFRGYYRIDTADAFLYKILMWPLRTLDEILYKVRYEVKYVEVVVSHKEEVWTEQGSSIGSCVDNSVVDVDGRKLEKHFVHVPSRFNIVPTKHKMLYKFKILVGYILAWQSHKLEFLNQLSRESEVIRERFDAQANELVNKCEDDCRKRCIQCGSTLDENCDSYTTNGWYTYVCKECASLMRGGLESCTDLAAAKHDTEQRKFEQHLAEAVEKVEASSLGTANQFAEALKSLVDIDRKADDVCEAAK